MPALCYSILFIIACGSTIVSAQPPVQNAPSVQLTASHPGNLATEVPASSSLHLRFSDAVDVSTLKSISLRTIGENGERSVKIRHSTDLTNASITIVPSEFLQLDRVYRIVGTDGLRAADGTRIASFEVRFETSSQPASRGNGLHFMAEKFDTTRSMTTVLFGPDAKLYAASALGQLVCWDIDSSGRPNKRTLIFDDPNQSRQFIDLEWDPKATKDNLLLWVSYAERLTPKSDPQYYFTGTISRLRIRDAKIVSEQLFVTGLPHGREVQGGHETLPHQPNGLCFKDGKLYQSVGSTSSSGGPANWGIPEQLLSACVLEIDYRQIGPDPIDVSPGNREFDPLDNETLVRRFATGVRNALEVIAHSNGPQDWCSVGQTGNTKHTALPIDSSSTTILSLCTAIENRYRLEFADLEAAT